MKRKSIKKIIKIIVILVCIIFCFMALQSAIITANTSHIIECHVEQCPVCMLIQNAINFIKNIIYIIEYIILQNVVIPLIYILISKMILTPQSTLTNLKVRFNE